MSHLQKISQTPGAPNPRIKRHAITLLRWLVGLIFVYAGVVKALDFDGFRKAISDYGLTSYSVASPAAHYLPWLEIACGLCLVCRRVYASSLLVLFLLMIIFTLALVSAWIRGIEISCGCFGGVQSHSNYVWLLSRDLVIGAAIYVLMRDERKPGAAVLPR